MLASLSSMQIESGGFCEVALSTDLWFWGFPATSLKPD